MNQRALRLEKMDALLARGIQDAGDETIERQVIEGILRNACFAGVPQLTYLREKLATASVVHPTASADRDAPAQPFKCTHPTCNRSFGSQMALNGHMKKHALVMPSERKHLNPSIQL